MRITRKAIGVDPEVEEEGFSPFSSTHALPMGNGGGCVGRGLVGAGDGKANTFVTSGWEDLGGGGGAGATELRLKKRDDEGRPSSHICLAMRFRRGRSNPPATTRRIRLDDSMGLGMRRGPAPWGLGREVTTSCCLFVQVAKSEKRKARNRKTACCMRIHDNPTTSRRLLVR